jgi:hypothetical protein
MSFLIVGISAAIAAVLATVPTKALQLCNGIKGAADSQVRPLCSATWQMKASCRSSGKDDDLWDKWVILGGRTKPQDSFIRPFESVPIDVVGYELVNMSRRPASDFADAWFMIGSGMTGYPDTMLWMSPGEMHAVRMFPAGFGQHWPSADVAKKSGLEDIINVHGYCAAGKDVVLFLTVYYSPIGSDQDEAVTR